MSIAIRPRAEAKAMLGVGAAAMTTQPMAPWINGQQSPHRWMKAAAGFWKSDPWVRAAERVISGKFSTVEWHLEDPADIEIDDEYPDPKYQAVWHLLEQPQANLAREDRQINATTRRELWAITSRHMGVCGSAFWYLDKLEPTGKTPLAILYIAPWRMHPSFSAGGNLTGWVLDWDENKQTGTPLTLDEVIQFNLEPPDEGAFPPGLIQSAMSLLNLDALAFGHAANVLTAGGRLAGIVSPKDTQSALPDDKFQQLLRDFRTVNELPDAARRTNILQGPVDFNRTGATLGELELIALMTAVRDDILALEGTPYSQLGGSVGTGLNSGDVRKYDQAALWENAVHLRLVPFQEAIQYQLLDRYKAFGIAPELEIDEPEFQDDGPRFDLLDKSAGIPLRNSERRDLVGYEPFGQDVLGASGLPLDDEIWMPLTIAQAGVAPTDKSSTGTSPGLINVGAGVNTEPLDNGVRPQAKAKAPAFHNSLVRLRSRIEREHTAPLKRAIAAFLEAQRMDIASRLRTNADHVTVKPTDHDAWFKKSRWDRELQAILARPLTAMAQNVNEHIQNVVPKKPTVKATPVSIVDRALLRGAARVTGINEKTRAAVQAFIVHGLQEGQTAVQLADAIESGVLLDNGEEAFDEYRAELIARTELMDAYNGAALGSYSDAGVSEVQALDGDYDEECANRDGEIFSVDEADGIEDHPNGTLDWVPIVDWEVKAAPMAEIEPQRVRLEVMQTPMPQPIINLEPQAMPAPIVNVEASPAPIIDTKPFADALRELKAAIQAPRTITKTVVRDESGRIIGIREDA